jgi:hypothetical protein
MDVGGPFMPCVTGMAIAAGADRLARAQTPARARAWTLHMPDRVASMSSGQRRGAARRGAAGPEHQSGELP